MPNKTFLRVLILTELILGVLYLLSSSYFEAGLPEPLRSYEEQHGGDLAGWQWYFIPTLALVALAARVGLFVFWRPARLIYLVTILVDSIARPFGGPNVDPAFSQMLNEAALIISGVVLALVYFSPAKDLYEKPKNECLKVGVESSG
jgi:hypothetical protein